MRDKRQKVEEREVRRILILDFQYWKILVKENL